MCHWISPKLTYPIYGVVLPFIPAISHCAISRGRRLFSSQTSHGSGVWDWVRTVFDPPLIRGKRRAMLTRPQWSLSAYRA